MSRGAAAVAALGLALLGVPSATAAQSCSAPIPNGTCGVNTSVTLTVGKVLELVLSAGSTTLSAPDEAGYDAGFVADAGPSATVRSNAPWTLEVNATAALWSATNTEPGVSARVDKPAGDLQWGTAVGGPFTSLSTSPAVAASGAATAGAVSNVFYRTSYGWALDTPGAYSLTVRFTLTAP